MPYKRIIVVGAGASGKNYAVELLKEIGMTYGPSYATREIRNNETNGIDYNFISREEFEKMISNREFIEYNYFNNNYYGTTKNQFYKNANLFILSPNVIESLSEKDRNESYIIFFDMPKHIIKERLFKRGMSEKNVNERLKADEIMLKDFNDYNLKVTDPKFEVVDLVYDYKHEEIES